MKSFEQIAQAMFKAASAFLGYDEEAWEILPEIDKQIWIAAAKAALARSDAAIAKATGGTS